MDSQVQTLTMEIITILNACAMGLFNITFYLSLTNRKSSVKFKNQASGVSKAYEKAKFC